MMTPLFIATAHAAAGAPGGQPGQQGNIFTSFLPLILIFAVFYFLMIRPQQKQQKKVREMLGALKKGDKVLMRSGIYGTISSIDENAVTVEIADNVRVKCSRDAIAALLNNGNS